MEVPGEGIKPEGEDFFAGLTLEIMQQARDDEEIGSEAHLIANALQVAPGAKLLDVPCGSGRHAIMFAEKGYSVTGLDNSEVLLATAREEAARRGLDINFLSGDMRDLAWHEEFNGAVCLWGSFGYFSDSDNLLFLRGVCAALRPGASLLIDTPIAESLLPGFRYSDSANIGKTILLETRHYDHKRSRVTRHWTMMQGRHIEKRTLSMRIYTYRELCNLAQQAGFERCEGYSSLDMDPFVLGDERFFMVASKAP